MADWSRDTKWRQGHFLCDEAIAKFALCAATDIANALVIVASHDCDLAQMPEVEPKIELVVGRVILQEDGNNTFAKNSRKLHLKLDLEGGSSCWGEFDVRAKIRIPKEELSSFMPREDRYLNSDNFNVFQYWLASRYRRSAFPDEFEKRLINITKLAEKISKAVKPHGDKIIGVFFDVDGGEEKIRNGPDDVYELDIIILHEADIDFEGSDRAATQAANAIKTAFNKSLFHETKGWQHISLNSCEVISESVLTYDIFKSLKRWRLEHISFAGSPQQPITE